MQSFIKKLHRLWLCISLVVFFAVTITAQSQLEESQTAPTTGAITGQVVTETGQPLAGAAVSVRAYGATGQGRSATTNAEGNFQVSGLDPLPYMVSASFSTYVTAPRDPDSSQAQYYRVGDSVRLELIRGGVITGTVTTAVGEQVVAVRERAYMIRDNH